MSVGIRIWNQSSAYVSIEPQWTMREDLGKIWNLNRTPSGNATIYTYATWREWKIPAKLIPASAASWINSLYLGQRTCVLEIIENSVSSVYSVMIVGKDSPFHMFSEPHINRMDGEIYLSEY